MDFELAHESGRHSSRKNFRSRDSDDSNQFSNVYVRIIQTDIILVNVDDLMVLGEMLHIQEIL